MTPHVRPSLRALTAFWLVTVVLVGPGCRRMVKPEAGEDRTVEAGVPVGFGSEAKDAPVVTWDFGDGSPPRQGARVSHAFPRAGAFTVRALEKDEVLASARVTVVPRPVLRAIPADAEVAVFFPQLRGNVEPLLGFYSRLVGEAQARSSLEEAPMLSLVLREMRGEPRLVDLEEGVGFFSLPGFEGTVGLLGVMDEPAALDAVVGELESGGATVVNRQPSEGLVHLRGEDGAPLLLFADRGYLYLVMSDTGDGEPEEGEPAEDEPAEARADVRPQRSQDETSQVDAIRARIIGMSGPGLSEVPLLTELRPKVGTGNVYVFVRAVGEDAATGIRGIWAAFRAEEGGRSWRAGWPRSRTSSRARARPARRCWAMRPRAPSPR